METDDLGTPTEPSTAQKKRSRGSGASTEKSSHKKAKKTGEKKVSDMLEKFIEELSSETTQVQEVMEEGEVFSIYTMQLLRWKNRLRLCY